MTREAWIAAAFFPLAALALWFANHALLIVAAFLAFAFLFCQGMILYAAKGIPAWRSSWVAPLILATGFAEGGGLFLAAITQIPALAMPASVAAIAIAVLALLRAFVWRSYLIALAIEGAPTRTIEVLDNIRPWLLFGGLALPLALILAGLVLPTASSLLALAGLCVLAAGVGLKFILVTRASFNQGF